MKTSTRAIAALAVLICAILATESAFARGRHHSRAHVGLYFGVPLAVGLGFGFRSFYPPPYYYPPYYHYPPYQTAPVVIQQQAPVYVEQNPPPAPTAQPSAPAYWYFCADSRAYYPYVKECPSGWQRVAPQPG